MSNPFDPANFPPPAEAPPAEPDQPAASPDPMAALRMAAAARALQPQNAPPPEPEPDPLPDVKGKLCRLSEVDHVTGDAVDRYGTVVDVRHATALRVGADGKPAEKRNVPVAVVAWVAGGVADGVPLEDLELVG